MSDTPDPVEIEAGPDTTITITFDGESYEIPASVGDVDVDAIAAVERGQTMVFVEALLGDRQWGLLKARYRAGHGGKFPLSATNPLGEQMAEVYGFKSLGESPASSD